MLQTEPRLKDKLADSVEDVHALEKVVVKNVDAMIGTLYDPTLDGLFSRHSKINRSHLQRLESRLTKLDRGSSVKRQLEGLAAELMKSLSDALRMDTPAKVARDVYLTAHRQIAAYELLRRLATHAGDAETQGLAELHLKQARAFADEVADHWDDFVRLTLDDWTLDEWDMSYDRELDERELRSAV